MEDFSGRFVGGGGIAAMLPQTTPVRSMGSMQDLQHLLTLQKLQSVIQSQQRVQQNNGSFLNVAMQQQQQAIPSSFMEMGGSSPQSPNSVLLDMMSANQISQVSMLNPSLFSINSLSLLASPATMSPSSLPLPPAVLQSLQSTPVKGNMNMNNFTNINNLFPPAANAFGVPEGTPMLTKRKFFGEDDASKSRKKHEGDSPSGSSSGTTSPSSSAEPAMVVVGGNAKPIPKMCEHGRRAGQCRDCGASNVCEHHRRRSRCKDCGGSGICVHNRQRNYCKDCGGSGICVHNRKRSLCKDCGGSSICVHKRQRSRCKDCGGSQICEHGRRRSLCKDCGGSQICQHQRQRSLCKECGGSQICVHKRRKRQCKECAEITAQKAAADAKAAGPSTN